LFPEDRFYIDCYNDFITSKQKEWMEFNLHQLANKDNKLKNDILNLKSMIKLRYSDIDNIMTDINHKITEELKDDFINADKKMRNAINNKYEVKNTNNKNNYKETKGTKRKIIKNKNKQNNNSENNNNNNNQTNYSSTTIQNESNLNSNNQIVNTNKNSTTAKNSNNFQNNNFTGSNKRFYHHNTNKNNNYTNNSGFNHSSNMDFQWRNPSNKTQ
jgi:hypothetical protein